MTNSQKLENEKYFTMVIYSLKEGGNYIWPNGNETYTMKGGKLIGSKTGIRKIKEVTTPAFHKNLIIK
jgi:hypothetical protein